VLKLTQNGGSFVTYFRATSNALRAPASSGSYYAVENQNPTFTAGVCSATAAMYQRVNNIETLLWSGPVECHDGMVVRVMIPDDGVLYSYLDDRFVRFAFTLSPLAISAACTGAASVPTSIGMESIGRRSMDRLHSQCQAGRRRGWEPALIRQSPATHVGQAGEV
jgi:hypothetical protein